MADSAATSLVHSFSAPDGSSRLGVIAKRRYRIVVGSRAVAEGPPPPLYTEPQLEPVAEQEDQLLRHDSDLYCFIKPLTDVLVRGCAHAPHGAATCVEAGVRVGSARKTVHVTGDRRLRVGHGGAIGATAPEGFASMPLDWRRAYGGRDRHAEDNTSSDLERHFASAVPMGEELLSIGTASYPRNRVGRGFLIDVDRERLDGALLPNLADLTDPVTPGRLLAGNAMDWIDRPLAACFEPIDMLTFPRCMFHFLQPAWLAPRRAIGELALGGLQADDLRDRQPLEPPDPRYYNCAPAGLAVCRHRGNERVSLYHLHREHQVIEFDLPGDRPRVLIEPPNTKTYELEPLLGTILVEPDALTMTLTWAAAMPVAAVFPEEMCKEMKHAAIWSH